MAVVRINRAILQEGQILHVRSVSILGSLIRGSQDHWIKKICRIKGVASNGSWGNHDGIVTRHPRTRVWGIGEALGGGSTFTPLDRYEARVGHSECFLRLYRPTDLSEEEMRGAATMWWTKVFGRKYDYFAYPRLIIKSWLLNFSYSKVSLLRKIGNKAAGMRHRFWCTEGVAEAYRLAGHDIYMDSNPTPMHTEMLAGELPMLKKRPIALELEHQV